MLKRYYCSALIGIGALSVGMLAVSTPADSQIPGDRGVLQSHVDQQRINTSQLKLDDLVPIGRMLFAAKFNKLDGFGRPAATGNGAPTHRDPTNMPLMNRVSGLDANSCAGCHNEPVVGGSGDFVANVFVLGQLANPPLDSTDPQFSNERNSLGMHGSGAIEALAVEMSQELIAIREAAKAAAMQGGQNVTRNLITKAVDFGQITARPDGTFDTTGVEGVDADLIIKPFHQKGVVNSLRVFTNNAYNHHHGMQSVERFGFGRTGTNDFDEDGVIDELSVGDITAATLFQAALPIPKQVLPLDGRERLKIRRGETLFGEVGCATCHIPRIILNRPIYQEPNPFNPPGNLRPQDVTRVFTFDLTRQGLGNRLERWIGGRAVVRAFTDLKRHKMTDAGDTFFDNERVPQAGVPTDTYLTRKLWDCGSSAPFGHRGDCSTMGEAIMHHAGDARSSRDQFMLLNATDQEAIMVFLMSLQVVP